MLVCRGNVFRYIFIYIVFFVSAEKFYFSKWINTDENVALYHFETLLNVGIQDCIEKCKSKKGCEFINYNTQAHTCAFVGVTPGNVDPLLPEVKIGYVFGNKSEWNMDRYEVCDDCSDRGVCGKDDPTGDIYSRCQDSGCGPPEQISLTVVSGNMFSVGASIKYECTEGYKPILINDLSSPIAEQQFSSKTYVSAVCQENGNWSFSKFRCLPDCSTQLYHDGLPNVARGKTVTLSTQFDENSPAKLMVDGDLDNKWPCASTKEEEQPSVLIDLGQSYTVTSIYIVNRVDYEPERLSRLRVAIGDSVSDLDDVAYREEPIDCDFTFKFDGGISGRFIKLQIDKPQETFTICELEVYAAE